MKIAKIKARQILDSRGNPTVEADVFLDDGSLGRAAVPSGASTGSGEALELRDGAEAYGGKGVLRAVDNVEKIIAPALAGQLADDQKAIDAKLLELDGTDNKSNLGANALLSVSLATAKAVAVSQGQPFWQYAASLGEEQTPSLPMPLMNLINGGKHAKGSTDIQEFMIVPVGGNTVNDAVRMGAEVFHALGKILEEKGYSTTVGDEGGYAPAVHGGNQEALELLLFAIEKAGYQPGHDVALALDVAASELYVDNAYRLATEKRDLNSDEFVDWLAELAGRYPIISIEDGLSEDDWRGWQALSEKLAGKLQLVGDDLFVTNTRLLQKGIDQKTANAILIKPNQIGTLSETLAAVKLAKQHNWRTVMSHRSGETEDVTIAHLAVGWATGQIKTGSLSRSERTSKYNELIRIAEANLPLANPFKEV